MIIIIVSSFTHFWYNDQSPIVALANMVKRTLTITDIEISGVMHI